jgi:PAS domain S-box-containing protein
VSENDAAAARPEREADPVEAPQDWAHREASLLTEIGNLSAALDAIRTGGIDAVMIPGPEGENLYAMTSTDRPYRVLVEKMGQGAVTVSERGTVLYANQKFADLTDSDRARLLGQDITDYIQTSDASVLAGLLSVAPELTAQEELTLLHPDGSTTPVLASATGLDLDGGTIVRCLIVADLTGRVEAEERFRLTMEYATIGVTLESPQGRFILVNPALCQMLGRDAQTLMAMTWQEVTHPDDVSVGEGLIDDLAAGKLPSFRVRKRYLKPDGSVLWGDMSMSCVRNDDGSVRNFIAQVLDVSEQEQAEQRLAESQEHFRLLAENASDVVMRLDPDRRFEWVSGSVADVLGWAAPDLLGHVVDEFIHPYELALFVHAIMNTSPEGTASTEVRFRRSDDSYRWVLCHTRLKVDQDGAPVALVGGLVDIEARKAVEVQELDRLASLERFQRLTVGRELKMIELKKEIESLKNLVRRGADEDGDKH